MEIKSRAERKKEKTKYEELDMKRIVTVIFAALLLLSSLSAVFTVQAYDWNNGSASVLYGSKWQQRNQEIEQMSYAFPQIYDLFYDEIENSVHVYGHLWEWRSDWGWYTGWTKRMRTQIQDCENDQYHDWATVFYYGHMGMEQIEGTNYYHYGFHESGEQTGSEPDLIWDYMINNYTDDNHNFVFLWVCRNGDTPGDDEPEPRGMSYCWFNRNLAYNGYSYPDAGPDCFIGFTGASPALADGMGTYTYPYGENIYKFWLIFFYYFALDGYSIKGALDQASYMVEYDGYWLDDDNRLSQGWDYYFPGWQGPGDPPDPMWEAGYSWGQMKIYGNGNIYLPQD